MKINIFWFRRDLRLEDNKALFKALEIGEKVQCVFIFDDDILKELDKNDARVNFIYKSLEKINNELKKHNSSLDIRKGSINSAWQALIKDYSINKVFINKDYEPYAKKRDNNIAKFLLKQNIKLETYKDQVIFESIEICKSDSSPYTIYTPYKNKWIKKFDKSLLKTPDIQSSNFNESKYRFPKLEEIGFEKSTIEIPAPKFENITDYEKHRDIPALDRTTKLGVYLRFGNFSIRKIVEKALENDVFLSELIWREFFMQILDNYPDVVENNFKRKYDSIIWRNNEEEFDMWKNGKTGYPIVDAAMNELNKTGFMHNRLRMITASFLCKHLLIDWKWGEAYFANKLLDYELSSNNGNWQWAAGTGCDAAPYFRVFNPYTQTQKFDKNLEYIHKWIPDYNPNNYLEPIVEHKFARERAIETYKKGLNSI